MTHAVEELAVRVSLFPSYYEGSETRGCDSQFADTVHCRGLVAAKSGADFRYYERESFRSANLVIHQGIANILHQTV